MESVKDRLIAEINKISERYEYYGFWKLGKAYAGNADNEDNPYLYFPSADYAHKALMEEFDKLTEDEFVPLETIGSLYFKDGDKLDIPFDIFKQKPKIHIEVPYNRDEPCEVSVLYKRPENETEIYGRLLIKIVHNARQKYIKSLDC